MCVSMQMRVECITPLKIFFVNLCVFYVYHHTLHVPQTATEKLLHETLSTTLLDPLIVLAQRAPDQCSVGALRRSK